MKKLLAIIAGFLAAIVLISFFKIHMNKTINNNSEAFRDLRLYERYNSADTLREIISPNTLPVFGSSELTSLHHYEQEISSFLNGEEMNIVTIGGGNFQSLSHSIALGSIADYIPSKKIAFFVSPQWFYENGVEASAFASRLSEDHLLEFLYNDNISKENKLKVLDRTIQLLSESPTQLERVKKYKNAIENKFSLNSVYSKIMNIYWNYRSEYDVYKQKSLLSSDIPSYDLSKIDYSKMLSLAENQGVAACTNNDFGIYDEYWTTYVEQPYNQGEVNPKTQIFTNSVEYNDLKLFLDIAKELNMEVMFVHIPVNAKWYSFSGSLCDEYYQNIRDVVADYDNITLIDMTTYENEKYFLKDIMHLGWKGWTRINEALYTEFTKQ